MSEFLLVVEGLAAGGADAAMFVSEDTYKGAMFGCAFAEPVHGYVWCDRHGWVLADEACVCGDCVHEAMEADFERLCEVEERAWLDTGRAAEWAMQQFVSQTRLTDEEEAVIGAQVDAWSDRGMSWEDIVAQEPRATLLPTAQFGEDWPDEGDRGEMAYRRINAREKAEFPCGEFDDGARWREPAQALSPLSPGQWASEPCGDPDDASCDPGCPVHGCSAYECACAWEEVDWRDRHAPDFDPVPVGRCRCGGLVVTQPGTTRMICVECGADYPESPGWE